MYKLILLSAVCLSVCGCTAEDREVIGNLGTGLQGAGASLQSPYEPQVYPRGPDLTPIPTMFPNSTYDCQTWANGDVSCAQR